MPTKIDPNSIPNLIHVRELSKTSMAVQEGQLQGRKVSRLPFYLLASGAIIGLLAAVALAVAAVGFSAISLYLASGACFIWFMSSTFGALFVHRLSSNPLPISPMQEILKEEAVDSPRPFEGSDRPVPVEQVINCLEASRDTLENHLDKHRDQRQSFEGSLAGMIEFFKAHSLDATPLENWRDTLMKTLETIEIKDLEDLREILEKQLEHQDHLQERAMTLLSNLYDVLKNVLSDKADHSEKAKNLLLKLFSERQRLNKENSELKEENTELKEKYDELLKEYDDALKTLDESTPPNSLTRSNASRTNSFEKDSSSPRGQSVKAYQLPELKSVGYKLPASLDNKSTSRSNSFEKKYQSPEGKVIGDSILDDPTDVLKKTTEENLAGGSFSSEQSLEDSVHEILNILEQEKTNNTNALMDSFKKV
ncbi:MAG: hypothetical protein BGO14_08410 [Chlamydiales bacterium 38-26]|nr:hypothetical protein [Chlamydiales bacterium]OJV11011.1 MAG: hypothetical protein BGO14_08410 [Chlamydiales bacterium 38-26]